MANKSKCKQCWTYFVRDINNPIEALGVKFDTKKCRKEFIRAKANKQKDKIKARKVKAKVKKAERVSVLKKKLWTIISLYIRLRDSDDDNMCICCSCWEKRHYKDSMQAWHYIASWQSSFHRYNEKNIHAQCYWCNVGKNWNVLEYQKFMIKKYWEEYTNWLFDTRNEMINLWATELKALIEQYKPMLEDIKSNKALD